MAKRPAWWHTMQEARRQACLAVDFYNRPGDRASYLDFVVHMHLAWQDLLHADLTRRGVNLHYRQKGSRRYERLPNGDKKSWDLAKCLKEEFSASDPTRANIEFFIGLRNKIEHRFQTATMIETAPHAHALVINFEAELVRRFGSVYSLGSELRFPVFVQSLTPEGLKQQKALRRGVPAATKSYVTKFEASLDPAVLADERFVYRVMMTPIKGPKTEADMALRFVRMEDLSAEDQRVMIESEGRAVIIEKLRDVALKDELLPAAAARAVECLIPFKFSTNDFTAARHHLGVGPDKGGKGRLPKSTSELCVWIESTKQWVYTQKFIRQVADLVATADGYRAAIGRGPVVKPATAVPAA
ncbi:uncharacterized protein DUF3644 [Nocardioides albertanoniae]|uniref:Uncharacterized protein DUF3644 n=2 Tax=Nocardioides TaxID=1839 RepID=A0A543A8Q1_9ACTN|nr:MULTISPECIES: DUF3644 domain-containing protein [Nocardioides]NYI77082.1 hypothetical protein [Nocardioides panzhihuensis]TQL68866.1 uncharacterized protein DUF3644 [Nocardioides albertanoniae]